MTTPNLEPNQITSSAQWGANAPLYIHAVATTAGVPVDVGVSSVAFDDRFVNASGDTMTGALVVPAATAANQAAQVTAIDTTTGRLAIGGVEIGDTGWRNVTSLLHADWVGTGSGILLRRQGNVVETRFNIFPTVAGADPTSLTFLVLPAGFEGQTLPVVSDFPAHTEVAPNLNPQLVTWRLNSVMSLITYTRVPDGFTFIRGQARYTTPNAWPTTLPGTAV